MNELLGLAYYAEIPAVIMDIQRVGPSTGMPTRTQQGDVLECAYASHGDTKHILLFPSNPAECFDFAVKAFDLAERFQTPVFMLSDLDIGMNDWVVPRLTWDDSYRPDRGRVLEPDQLEKIAKFLRYTPEDENYVAARTLPGVNSKGAFFTRGSGHNKFGAYTETPDEYQEVLDRLLRKHKAAAKFVPAPIDSTTQGRAIRSRHHRRLRSGGARGARYSWQRAGSRPISCACGRFRSMSSVEAFLNAHDFSFIVEQNRDAQLRSLLTLETSVPKEKLRSVLVYGGFPMSAKRVIDGIMSQVASDLASSLER